MQALPSDGARRAGEHLNRLLAGPYRHVWLSQAGRLREAEVNRLAVARVVAQHLWETGDRSDRDLQLPTRLRDRVGRALTGEVLTPSTLDWFINAFRMDDMDAARLWTLLYGDDPPPPDTDDGWYVESLHSSLLLDEFPPHALERRVIVATRDGLHEITTSISVPRAPGDNQADHRLLVEALSGGTIEAREHPHPSYFRQVLALPAPIDAGQAHEFVLRRAVPEGQPMAPHYVTVPHRRIDYFELRVRFGTHRPPPSVWRLSGVPTSVIYDDEPTADLVPCEDGEAYTYFRGLVQGFGYGLRWSDEALKVQELERPVNREAERRQPDAGPLSARGRRPSGAQRRSATDATGPGSR